LNNHLFNVICQKQNDDSSQGATSLGAVWSFGLEWNRCLRMMGLFGDHREAAPIIAGLPEHEWHVMNASERYREEVPLADEEDSLFGETTTGTF
jgi:hypothetical protein